MSGMIRLFKTRVYVSIFAILLFALISFSCDAPFLYIAIGSALFHEMGHIFAMRLFGVGISAVNIYPFGADISADTSPLSYRSEIIVALSGPCVSLALCAVFYILFITYNNVYILAALVSNLLFFAVNIFPVRGLDGARALQAFLLGRFDFAKGYKIFAYVSTGAFALLCLFALFLLYVTGYNLSLVFICAYLFVSEYARQKIVK